MDEYTFILAAKLEADRRRLEQEAAAERLATQPPSERPQARHTAGQYSPRIAPLRFLAWR